MAVAGDMRGETTKSEASQPAAVHGPTGKRSERLPTYQRLRAAGRAEGVVGNDAPFFTWSAAPRYCRAEKEVLRRAILGNL